MYSVSFTKHTLECSVIVFGVLGKPFVREERRRGQELCVGLNRSLLKVVGVGLITCVEVGLVKTSPYSLGAECAGCLRTSSGGIKWMECDRRCVHADVNLMFVDLVFEIEVSGARRSHRDQRRRCLMFPTFVPSKPSVPTKSISLSKCPVFPTIALFFVIFMWS